MIEDCGEWCVSHDQSNAARVACSLQVLLHWFLQVDFSLQLKASGVYDVILKGHTEQWVSDRIQYVEYLSVHKLLYPLPLLSVKSKQQWQFKTYAYTQPTTHPSLCAILFNRLVSVSTCLRVHIFSVCMCTLPPPWPKYNHAYSWSQPPRG